MKATLTNTINNISVEVHSTTEHPASSYGKSVWVDDDNQAYCQVGMEAPFYRVEITEMPSLVEQLAEEMKRQGVILSELSQRTGINIGNLCNILNGKTQPRINTITAIAKALGMELALVTK